MRLEDEYPYDRTQRTTQWRIGTIAAVSSDGKRLEVNTPDGRLTRVMSTTAVPPTVGTRIVVLLNRDESIAIGTMR